ncbi:hypothetical protein I7I53_11096 [Histoplasma capsulatum var. duboisii H88]|uniref:Uncharacterized protein n=1 Tax=Ajellomyces capsulatus (strain H88) TaxID=544711 RepID=A0A8A1L9V4_AJEC8|nr:hypothetical protein I7I53_11096 [Histoplasma capsulatum var. duboisii H88]
MGSGGYTGLQGSVFFFFFFGTILSANILIEFTPTEDIIPVTDFPELRVHSVLKMMRIQDGLELEFEVKEIRIGVSVRDSNLGTIKEKKGKLTLLVTPYTQLGLETLIPSDRWGMPGSELDMPRKSESRSAALHS